MADFLAHRWVELVSLHRDFTMLELDRLADYGFTAVTLWSCFEDFDNYIYTLPVTYRRQAAVQTLRMQDKVEPAAEFLREATLKAHRRGLQVLHIYHLCNFAGPRIPIQGPRRDDPGLPALRALHPDWFNAHGEPDFARDGIYQFIADEVEDFFDQFPHVDGLACWNCECSSFTPTLLSHQTVSRAQVVARVMRTVYDVCDRRGKLMTHDIHAAGADEAMTRAIIAGAAACPDLILGADATYSDWHMHLPTTPWLAEMSRHNRVYLGLDAAGEFFGQGRTIAGWPRWLTGHFDAARQHRLAAVSVRAGATATANSCLRVPMLEFNLALAARLAREGQVEVHAEIDRWWDRHFGGPTPAGFAEVFLSFEAILERMLYINGTNITTYNPDHSFPSVAIHEQIKGYPCWHSEQFTRPGTPITMPMIPAWGLQAQPIATLRQEKLDALALCDAALDRLRRLPMPGEQRDYFVRRVAQARDVCAAFLHCINTVYPLCQLMVEHHDLSMTDPRAELRRGREQLLAHAHAMAERWGNTFYRNFTQKMQQFAADIPDKWHAPAPVSAG